MKGLVGLHGGTVEAFSEGVGKGSRFTVRLPLIAPPEAAPVQTPVPGCTDVPGPADGAVAVVIVDDNVDAAETLASVMELLGYRVRIAHSATEAFRMIAASPPRAAVFEIGLPDMNGYQLANRSGPAIARRDDSKLNSALSIDPVYLLLF